MSDGLSLGIGISTTFPLARVHNALPGEGVDNLLLEDGFNLLLEDGGVLILE